MEGPIAPTDVGGSADVDGAPGGAGLAPSGVLDDVRHRLQQEHGFRVAAATPLAPDTFYMNRLLRLRADDGREAVLKLYLRDGQGRLEREYGALAFLRRRGFTDVPAPYLRSDAHYYAVYTLEAGGTRRAAEWTAAHVAGVARFAAALHRVRPGEPGAAFPPAHRACFSLAERVAEVRRNLDRFWAFAAGLGAGAAAVGVAGGANDGDGYAAVRALVAEVDVRVAVEGLLAAATASCTPAELEARVPEADRRLSPADFAPHNVLVRPAGHPAGPVCVVDLERFGWDDPTAPVAGFVTADSALDLPPALADHFVRVYREACREHPGQAGPWEPGSRAAGPADREVAPPARLARLCALSHVRWCSIHLVLLTPERVAEKRFATPDLDAPTYLAEQAAKFRRRLGLAERAGAALTVRRRSG